MSRAHAAKIYGGAVMETTWTQELGIDDFQANRGPEKQYRTAPLSGLWTHQAGGFYHDGRFATLDDVVSHYDTLLGLHLTGNERGDLVQFLKSL